MINSFPVLIIGGKKNRLALLGEKCVLSGNDVIYSVQQLKEQAALFDNAPLSIDHDGPQVGSIHHPHWSESAAGLLAIARITDAKTADLLTRHYRDRSALPGLSIDANLALVSWQEFKLAGAFTAVNHVAITPCPAAGGRFLTFAQFDQYSKIDEAIRRVSASQAAKPAQRLRDTFYGRINGPTRRIYE